MWQMVSKMTVKRQSHINSRICNSSHLATFYRSRVIWLFSSKHSVTVSMPNSQFWSPLTHLLKYSNACNSSHRLKVPCWGGFYCQREVTQPSYWVVLSRPAKMWTQLLPCWIRISMTRSWLPQLWTPNAKSSVSLRPIKTRFSASFKGLSQNTSLLLTISNYTCKSHRRVSLSSNGLIRFLWRL